jgi:hypothetical protein
VLRFAKALPYLPDPAPADDAAQGSALGWTLSYGYLTSVSISGRGDGGIIVRNLAQLVRETGQERIIDQFAVGYFGLGSGYSLITPAGLVTLIIAHPHSPAGLGIVTGLIETDWYPRQLFVVCNVPGPGVQIDLEFAAPLAHILAVPRQDAISITESRP